MKKQILLFAFTLILSINSYSQIVFENGYFIDANDQKINCLIENLDWKNNPSSFNYKLSDEENVKTIDIKSVKEFMVKGQSKFIKALVKIDRSSEVIENMSKDKNPIFNDEILFLKVLIEGKASLFLYDDGIVRRFFYKIDGSEIKQLVYKTYLVNNESFAKNNYFKEQLYIDLKCDDISQNEYEYLSYSMRSLKRFFMKYNRCYNSEVVDFEIEEKKDLFNLTIRPRYNSSSLSVEKSATSFANFDFGVNSNLSLGIEAEFILPFNRNRWSVFVEPTYQYYKSDKTVQSAVIVGGLALGSVDYKVIELPIGVRRYFFVNNNLSVFANAAFVLAFNSDSKINFVRSDGSEISSLEIKSGSNFGFGIGCKFMDRYSLEMRYQTARTLYDSSASYKSGSVIFGYSFF